MKKRYYILILFGLFSCETEDVPRTGAGNLLVVQGWFTDLDTFQTVKLSLSQDFLVNEQETYVQDAGVFVSGNNGESYAYDYVGNGVYQTRDKEKASSGVNYTLTITLSDGRIITSPGERMKRAPSIDTLGYDYYERPSEENQNIIEQVYYPILQFQDPGSYSNYYRIKAYKNDTLFAQPENMILINDRFFNGNKPKIENEFALLEYFRNDSISLELHEISRDGYEFLRLLKSQTTSLGSASSVTPSPINSNLQYLNSNEAVLGYWGTASIQRAGIKIIQ